MTSATGKQDHVTPTAQPEARAAPLQDPRSHPSTRTLGEGLITAGRGQAPNAQTFAGLQR
jgi:hypothetical protein